MPRLLISSDSRLKAHRVKGIGRLTVGTQTVIHTIDNAAANVNGKGVQLIPVSVYKE